MKVNDEVKGLVQVENYKGAHIPLDKWDIITPLDDIIMAEYVDSTDGEHVERDGLLLPTAMVQHSWRVCKVLKTGPKVANEIKEGTYIMIPSDKGLPAVQNTVNGKKKQIVFINEARIFCIVKPRK